MNTRTESYFLEIAKQKSISKAAERLFVSQSTLSQFLLNLEKELDTRLFERGKHELILTSDGAVYLEGAKEILRIKEQVYETISQRRGSKQKPWKVGISSREGLHLFLEGARRFQVDHPEVIFDIVEDNVRPIVKMLEAGDLHMAILVLNKTDDIKDHWELLKAEEILLAIPGGTDLQSNNQKLQELQGLKAILAKKGTAFRVLEDEILQHGGSMPQVAMEIDNIEAVKELVADGLGFSFIPASMVEASDTITYFSLQPSVHRYHVLGLDKDLLPGEPVAAWISTLKNVADPK